MPTMSTEDQAACRKTNIGSNRPLEIHTRIWAGAGELPQRREVQCREAEELGQAACSVPESLLQKLSQWCMERVVEAIARHDELQVSRDVEEPSSSSSRLAAVGLNFSPASGTGIMSVRPDWTHDDPHLNARP